MKYSHLMLLLTCVFCFTVPVNGMTLNRERTLKLSGKAYSNNAFRTEDSAGKTMPEDVKAGTLIQQRNTVQVEFDHDLNEYFRGIGARVNYHLVGRAFYDSVYDYGPDMFSDEEERAASMNYDTDDRDQLDEFKWDAELWEAYIDVSKGPVFIRVGRQNLSWGESDGIPILDRINPVDDSYGAMFLDPDEKRIPLAMIRMSYDFGYLGPFSSLSLEGYVVPNNIEDRVAPIPPKGTPYYPPMLTTDQRLRELLKSGMSGAGSSPVVDAAINLMIEDLVDNYVNFQEPVVTPDDSDFSNSRMGIKLGGILGDNLSFQLAHFQSYTDLFTPRLAFSDFAEYQVHQVPELGASIVYPENVYTEFNYEKVSISGFSLNFYEMHLDTVFRMEAGYFYDEPVTIFGENLIYPDFTKLLGHLGVPGAEEATFGEEDYIDGEIVHKDVIRFSFGIDKKFWMRPLNHKATFFMICQYAGQWILDYDSRIVMPINDWDVLDPETGLGTPIPLNADEHIVFTRLATSYFNGKLIPEVVVMVDTRGENVMFATAFEYIQNKNFRLKLKYGSIEEETMHLLGVFKDRDQVSLLITWLFN